MTSGAAVITETALNMPIIKDTAAAPDVQLVLPDPRKQRKQSKQLYLEKGMYLHRLFHGKILTIPVSIRKVRRD